MKIGTGWLGWTERDTLDTSMPTIILAYEGRIDMLRAIFGGADATPVVEKPEPLGMPAADAMDIFRSAARARVRNTAAS